MTAAADLAPMAPDVFTWPSAAPCLIGGRNKVTGKIAFPWMDRHGEAPVELSRHGVLWSWTVQRFLPKQPPYRGVETAETFRPFALGYVELPGQVRVETRLTGCAPEALHIGMEMELVIVPFEMDTAGNQVLTFAFQPVVKGEPS